jgi:hypothetical protein
VEAVAVAAVEAAAAVVEASAAVAVEVEATAARVEWEEADAGVDTAGLRCRVVAIAAVEALVAEARPGTSRDPVVTARVEWLPTRMSPEETSTDPKPPLRFNLVREALGPVFLRLPKEIGLGPAQAATGLGQARAATKGSPISRTKLAAANSLGKVKELEAASSVKAASLQAKSKPVKAASLQARSKPVRAASLQAKSKAVRAAGCRAVNWARWREARWRGARSAPVSLI